MTAPASKIFRSSWTPTCWTTTRTSPARTWGRPHHHRHRGPDPRPAASGGQGPDHRVEEPPPRLPLQRHTVEYLRTIQHLRPGPTYRLFSAAFGCAPWPLTPSTASSRTGASSMSTPHHHRQRPKGRARCSGHPGDLDLMPNPDGTVDYTQDFFGKRASPSPAS